MNENTNGVLIFGSGSAAKEHLVAFKCLGVPIYVHSRDGQRTLDISEEYTVEPLYELTAGFPDKVKACVIASDPSQNEYYLNHALKSNCLVLIEKPGTVNSGSIVDVAKRHKRHPTTIRLGYVLRFYEVFTELRRHISNRSIGRINEVRDHRLAYRPLCEKFWWKSFNTHLLGFQGVHSLDLLQWLFGELKLINAKWGEQSKATGWIDEFTLNIQIGSIKGTIIHSFQWREPAKNSFVLIGQNGELEVKDFRYLNLNGTTIFDAGDDFLHQGILNQAEDFIHTLNLRKQSLSCSAVEADKINQFVKLCLRECLESMGETQNNA